MKPSQWVTRFIAVAALAVAALAVAAQAATLVRHPYLQNVRPNAVTVMWTTLEPGQGRVEFQV